jgi:hypothetical protein
MINTLRISAFIRAFLIAGTAVAIFSKIQTMKYFKTCLPDIQAACKVTDQMKQPILSGV